MTDKELHFQALSIINDIRKAEKSGERIPLYKMNHLEARNAYLAMTESLSPPAPKVFQVKNFFIELRKIKIPIRYYRGIKHSKKNILPVTVFFHGGGWVIGDLDTHDVVCRQLANLGDFDVISVNYRMGPENSFPAAVNDATSSINWIANNKINLPIDSSKIAVCGDSAGGNLAAVCCINSKINSGPLITYQTLIYPATHMGNNYPSKNKYDGYILSKRLMKWFEEKYIGNNQGDFSYSDWRISPICYDYLHNLPPALIIMAECDPLKDEGIAYAEKLKKSGNDVETVIFDGQIHGFLTMGARIDDADKLITMVARRISASLSK